MRFLAVVPDPVTGVLAPYRGVAGIPIAFRATDRTEALRLAKLNKLPATVSIMTPEEYEAARARSETQSPAGAPF